MSINTQESAPGYLNFSGGKDCNFTLHLVRNQVKLLLSTMHESTGRVSMHGIRMELLEDAAKSLGIPIEWIKIPENSFASYEETMKTALLKIKESGLSTAYFGDIFLQDLREYRETNLKQVDIEAKFPLWKRDTTELIKEFVSTGFKAVIVCVDASKLDKSWLGKTISLEMLQDLPPSVDPCGENGEYHTFVYDGPTFSYPIKFTLGETVLKSFPASNNHPESSFYYLDLIPSKDK